jgi:hypothetical protein
VHALCELHDNAHLNTACATQQMLKSFKWEVMAHPSHNPTHAPSNYYCFLTEGKSRWKDFFEQWWGPICGDDMA